MKGPAPAFRPAKHPIGRKRRAARSDARGTPSIRRARLDDILALLALERRAFTGDWLSPRSFRHLLSRGNAATLVEAQGTVLRGYAMLLFSRSSRLARLYSFAVGPEHRGQGLAKALLAAAERIARARGCDRLRLEVRQDNREAQTLYRKAGFRAFGTLADYYEDHMDALRMEKPLTRAPLAQRRA